MFRKRSLIKRGRSIATHGILTWKSASIATRGLILGLHQPIADDAPVHHADDEIPTFEADDAVPSFHADDEIPTFEADDAIPSFHADDEIPELD